MNYSGFMTKKILEKDFNSHIHVKEYKRKCNGCKKVWHSLASRESEINKNIKFNSGQQACHACSNHGAALQAKRNAESNQELLDKLLKCPKCGSANYTENVNIFEKKE